jgi:hypothetical protein
MAVFPEIKFNKGSAETDPPAMPALAVASRPVAVFPLRRCVRFWFEGMIPNETALILSYWLQLHSVDSLLAPSAPKTTFYQNHRQSNNPSLKLVEKNRYPQQWLAIEK